MTDLAISAEDVQRWHKPLGDLLETTRRRIGAGWAPAWKGAAEIEIAETAALLRDDQTLWGEGPARTTLPVAGVLLQAAMEHADAVHVLLAARTTSALAIEAMARAALEAGAQAWWLLEPDIGGRTRVVRRHVLERQTAQRLETSAKSMGITVTAGLGKSVADTQAERDALQIRDDLSAKGVWLGCEGQAGLNYTSRVATFMEETKQEPARGPYAFVCGASHAELWRIYYGYTPTQLPDGSTMWTPRTPRDFVRFAVTACIEAVIQPAGRAFYWLGRGGALEDLRRLEAPIIAAMRP